jgi:hypothetical protein
MKANAIAQSGERFDQQAGADALRGKPGLSMIGLLIVEMIIGYEWFISGLTKFVHGDFPSGLAGELADKTSSTLPGYASFLNGVVIPNATFFGYIIEIAEILAGVVLIIGPLIWLFAWDRNSNRGRTAVVFLIAAAAFGGILMAVNFHIAAGDTHPWLVPASSFDEGIDLDAFLTAIQIGIVAVNIILLGRLRQERT